MAELIIKIGTTGPDPAYQDGDIISAYNNRAIRSIHAQHICNPNNFGFKPDGLRPDSLAKFFFETTRKYRFERISRTQVNRIEISTLEAETISDVPNAKGEYIDVGLFLRRKLLHPKHLIFGTPGNEIWYGGTTDYTNTNLSIVWAGIESRTANVESNFTLFPLGTQDKKSFLSIKVNNFTDSEAVRFTSTETDEDGVTPDGDPIINIIQKRKWRLNWRSLTLPASIPDIENRTKAVDVRNVEFSRPGILIEKPTRRRIP